MAVDGLEPAEDLQELRNVVGSAAMDEVEVHGEERHTAQYPGHHSHHDELDVVRGEPAEDLSVPGAGH